MKNKMGLLVVTAMAGVAPFQVAQAASCVQVAAIYIRHGYTCIQSQTGAWGCAGDGSAWTLYEDWAGQCHAEVMVKRPPTAEELKFGLDPNAEFVPVVGPKGERAIYGNVFPVPTPVRPRLVFPGRLAP